MNYGITEKSFRLILEGLNHYPEIEKALIFGSRAIGNYKNGSDIDLALYGSDVTEETIRGLRTRLNEELPIPYYFDIIHYENINNQELKEHIDTMGKMFYTRRILI